MNETDFIRNILRPLVTAPESASLEDDVAVLPGCVGPQIITTDTLVEGVHFRTGDDWFSVGRKLVRVNVSDVLSKAALPASCLLNLTWNPDYGDTALETLVAGIAHDLSEFGISLIGGDTTSHNGPVVLSLTLTGVCARSSGPVRRCTASAGDDLWVTGTIGDASLGLAFADSCLPSETRLNQRYLIPNLPCTGVVRLLADYASASMDVSDGLVTDAGKLATASGLRLVIQAEHIPVSPEARSVLEPPDAFAELLDILDGGDDYQSLFTSSAQNRYSLMDAARAAHLSVTRIGYAEDGQGVVCLMNGADITARVRKGWDHRL